MALPNKLDRFLFNHEDQVDAFSQTLRNTKRVKDLYDSREEQLRLLHNSLVPYIMPGGKRQLVIGLRSSGYTEDDVDYLIEDGENYSQVTAAYRAAYAALPESGGEILFLDGSYDMMGEETIYKDNVTIRGVGKATIFRKLYWNPFPLPVMEGMITLWSATGCILEDFCIDMNKEHWLSHYLESAIVIRYGEGNIVRNISMKNGPGCGVYVDGSSCNKIENIDIDGFSQDGIWAGGSTPSQYNIIKNNDIKNGKSYAIRLSGSGNYSIISGNNMDNNQWGIMEAGKGNVVRNNVSRKTTTTGILSQGKNGSIYGNKVYESEGDGIYVPGGGYAVYNNISNDNAANGIRTFVATGRPGVAIAGNICKGNDNGIDLHGRNESVFSNTCLDNEVGIKSTYSGYGYSAIVGNTCMRGQGNVGDYSGSQYTISASGSTKSIIAMNNCMGKGVTGTGNTLVHNKYE